MTVAQGASASLLRVLTNGTGVVLPGVLAINTGAGLEVRPNTSNPYVLTVTNAAGVAVTRGVGVTVVPAGALISSPSTVQASGGRQATPGGTFSNGPVGGESLSPATVGTYPSGTDPRCAAFKGTHIWVTNGTCNKVTKLLAKTGATVGIFAVGSSPNSSAIDGIHIWVANFGTTTVSVLPAR